MPTYVNDLRLKEIATGDEAGTWGDSTNTNLELIGEALGFGTEAITTNADTHTTTVADGATDPGRAMYLKYTGTLDSACTITIAPNTISRMQFIENGTSGSQNIIISQGSGANITIPPGDTKAVYLDGAGSGAAVVDAFASLNTVDLKVEDDLTVTDDVSIGGALTLTGNGDFNGDLDVDGTTNLDVVDIDGAVDMASTLQVDGAITSSSDLTLTSAGPSISLVDSDNNPDYQIKNGNGSLRFIDTTNSVDLATLTAGEFAINEGSADVNFRVESNGQANMLFVDGGNDRVGVGTGTPATTVDIRTSDGSDAKLRLGSSSSIGLDVLGTIEFFSADVDDSGIKSTIHNLSTGNQGPGGSLSGNLVFSTTASDGGGNDSPSERMRIDSTGVLKLIGSRSTFVDASEDSAARSHMFVSNDAVGDFSQEAGHLVIQARTHTSVYRDIIFAGGINNASELVRISGEGNLFASTNIVQSSTNAVLFMGGSTQSFGNTAGIGIAGGDNFHVSGSATGDIVMGAASGENIVFGTASSGGPTNRLKIAADGVVTIGNLSFNGTSSSSLISAGNVILNVSGGILTSGSSSLDLQFQVPVTGVGTSTAAKLDAPTGDWFTNDGSVSSLSDSRLKKDITTLTDGIDIVKQLRPITFKYDDTTQDEDGSKYLGAASETVRYGFVAQEVESVAPQYVASREGKVKGKTVSDLKSLSQTRMIPMLVKSIQELEARITTLEGE